SRCSSLFPDPSPTEPYPLSLHDALPILRRVLRALRHADRDRPGGPLASQRLLAEAIRHRTNLTVSGASGPLVAALDDVRALADLDRKSTRLNSSHVSISYAVFCLKKKKI